MKTPPASLHSAAPFEPGLAHRRHRRFALEIVGLSAVGVGLVLAGLLLPATPAPNETKARAASAALVSTASDHGASAPSIVVPTE